MPDFHPIITNFTAGELSPSVYGRVDVQRYSNGVKKLENFLIQPQGGIVRRPGFQFVNAVKTQSKKTRLVNFEFSSTQAYQLEFGENYIRFYKNKAQITSTKTITGAANNGSGLIRITSAAHGYANGNTVTISGITGTTEANGTWIISGVTTNTFDLVASTFTNTYTAGGTAIAIVEVVTTFTESELFNISFTQSADVLYICHESHWPQKLSRTSHTAWTLTDLEKNDGPYLDKNEDDSISITTSVAAKTVTGCANNGSGLIRVTTSTAHGYLTGTKVVVASVTGTTEANGTWWVTKITDTTFDLVDSTFTNVYVSGGTATGDALLGDVTLTATSALFESTHVGAMFRLEESSASKNNEWKTDTAYTKYDRAIYKGLIFEAQNTATSGTRPPIHETGTEYDGPSKVQWRFLHQGYGVVTITGYTSSTVATGTITSRAPNSLTAGSIRWREGAWSTKRGFPGCVCFFEERLVFARTSHQPQTTWMSRSGDYEVFSPTIQDGKVMDTTGITYTISSNKVNAIQWISSGSVLVFGTIGEEWQAFSGKSSEPMTPANIQVKPQTASGSALVKVIKIGSAYMFVQRSGRKLRELQYNYEVDGLQAKDMNLLADHILREGDGVTDACYQQEPFSIWHGARTDGQIASLTYLKDQEIAGWSRHILGGVFGDGDAVVESVSTIPNESVNADQLWIVVKRTINGSTTRYIEVLDDIFYPDDNQDKANMNFLDSFLRYDATAKTISGATKANPVVITATSHGFSNGDHIKIEDVSGMTEINDKWFVVANKSTHTFELTYSNGTNVDGSAYTTYTSGGSAYKGVLTLSGLDHLEGQSVGVCIDGSIKPNEVVSSGAITLDDYFIRACVGLKYLSKVTTIRPEGGAQLGTAQGKVKRTNIVDIRLFQSLGLYYGSLDTYADDLPFRLPEDPMDQSPPFFTGDKSLQLDQSYTDEGYITIASDYPYPLSITAIMPELEVYEQR